MNRLLHKLLYRILPLGGYLQTVSAMFFLSHRLGIGRHAPATEYTFHLDRLMRAGDLAIDIGAKLGKSLYDVVPGIERGDREDVIVGTAEEVIRPGAADIVVVCTNSFTRDVYDKLVFVMERGMNVITSAEEMAYPQAQEPELAAKLDEIAKYLYEKETITGEEFMRILTAVPQLPTGAVEQ